MKEQLGYLITKLILPKYQIIKTFDIWVTDFDDYITLNICFNYSEIDSDVFSKVYKETNLIFESLGPSEWVDTNIRFWSLP